MSDKELCERSGRFTWYQMARAILRLACMDHDCRNRSIFVRFWAKSECRSEVCAAPKVQDPIFVWVKGMTKSRNTCTYTYKFTAQRQDSIRLNRLDLVTDERLAQSVVTSVQMSRSIVLTSESAFFRRTIAVSRSTLSGSSRVCVSLSNDIFFIDHSGKIR